MNWRRYKVLIIGGGACFILLVITIVFMLRSSGEYRAANKKLKSSVSRLGELQSNDPYPSSANIGQLRENRKAIQAYLEDLREEMAAGQVKPLHTDPSGFVRYFERIRNALVAEAAAATGPDQESDTPEEGATQVKDESGVVLPDGIDFGFGKYAKGIPPTQEQIERLTIQLQTITRICKDLFALGISELSEVSREDFESRLSSKRDEFMSGMDLMGEQFAWMGIGDEEEEEEEAKEERLYSSEHYEFTFTCSEDVAWQVLDKLTHHDLFLVLTSVSIENVNAGLGSASVRDRPDAPRRRPPRRTSRRRTQPSTSTPSAMSSTLGIVPGQLEVREARAGREKLRMVVELDAYRIKLDPDASPEAGN